MDITHWVIFLIQLVLRWPDTGLYRNTVRMTLENVESKILLESYSMIKMELQHVMKRISHGMWLDMIFYIFNHK